MRTYMAMLLTATHFLANVFATHTDCMDDAVAAPECSPGPAGTAASG